MLICDPCMQEQGGDAQGAAVKRGTCGFCDQTTLVYDVPQTALIQPGPINFEQDAESVQTVATPEQTAAARIHLLEGLYTDVDDALRRAEILDPEGQFFAPMFAAAGSFKMNVELVIGQETLRLRHLKG